MSNNYQNQQEYNSDHREENKGLYRTGSMVYDYYQHSPQAPQQYSPPLGQTLQGAGPYSPTPDGQAPQQQIWPSAQGWPSPSFITNAMEVVRRWSGKMRAQPYVDQQPLVLYHPVVPPPPNKSKPWKRSRSVRVAMQMRHRRLRWERSRPNGKKIGLSILLAFSLFIAILISSGTASAYAYYQSQLPRLQGLAGQQIDQTSRIYDRNGQLLYDAYDNKEGRRTPIAYKYIPGVMQDAMIATEDNTFWDNSGVNPLAILRAATQDTQSGQVQSGASTITQQLIKNLTGDTQVSLQRKIPEAALAIGLTQQYPKWKILEMYFNVSPFGAQELGVEAAVEDYFGLKPKCDQNFNCIPAIAFLDLNASGKHDPLLALARASLLAGMPQNPPNYDPTVSETNRKLALERQDYVLNQMLQLHMQINLGLGDQVNDAGPITQDVINKVEAMTAKMQFPGYSANIRAPHFVLWIISQLENVLGNGDTELGAHLFLTGGFNIRTTLDLNLEEYVENAVHRHLDEPEYQPFVGDDGPLNTVHNVNDSAVVVMSAKTGEIWAMDGSADWNSTDPRIAGKVNAALSPRQPGSSFKPILYATAFQMGWYPGIVLPDTKTYFPTTTGPQSENPSTDPTVYTPSDYGGVNHYNNVNSNIRIAISNSFNIPAVKTVEFTGITNVLNMARRLGITDIDQDTADYNKAHGTHYTVEQNLGPSFALGTAGVSLLQMVGAYQVFADQGMRVPPQGILDIWDNYGHHLYHYDPSHPNGVQVLSPQISFLISSILSDEKSRAFEFGNDHVLSMWDWDSRDVAAKTGTTDNFKDNWTIGYTPDVVVGVWSGNADAEEFVGHVVGITGAAPIWHDVIEYVSGRCDTHINCSHFSFPPDKFVPPPGVIQQTVSSTTGLAGGGDTDWMLNSDVPLQNGYSTTTSNNP